MSISMREIKRIATETGLLSDPAVVDSFIPNLDWHYFKLGRGLVIYRPDGEKVEMYGALYRGDVSSSFVASILKQWQELARIGYKGVFAKVRVKNLKSSIACRLLNMDKITGSEFNIYRVAL